MRLIYAEKLINELNRRKILYRADVNRCILDAPTVDAVEVVRCQDCRWSEKGPFKEVVYCTMHHKVKARHGYCDDGIRREG